MTEARDFMILLSLAGAGAIVVHNVGALRRLRLPIGLVGGALALLLSPQVVSRFSDIPVLTVGMLETWDSTILLLVEIVFASIFLGRRIPELGTMLRQAAPQASLGQTMAWGQYLVGGLVTLTILGPLFGSPDVFASLIEVSFQGGIGVAAAMEDTYELVGADAGADLALSLAPLAMLSGILFGTYFIQSEKRSRGDGSEVRAGNSFEEDPDDEDGSLGSANLFTRSLIVQLGVIGLAIVLGHALSHLLVLLEDALLRPALYETAFARHVPVFPLALLGGIAIQAGLDRWIPCRITDPQLLDRIREAALNLIIVSAMANLSLAAVGDHLGPVLVLFLAGTLWNVTCFKIIPRFLFSRHSFERSIADFGQSMGTTSIGLVLFSMGDPDNESGGRQAFGFKQLLFEPLVGGGIVTATSPLLIQNIGLVGFTAVAGGLTVFFLSLGILFRRWQEDTASES